MRQGRPAHPIMVLISPDFGEPRIDQAMPATSGGTNSGIRLAAATKPRHGVLVRTTIQENVSPMMTARAVPPVQAISELASARCTLGLPSTRHAGRRQNRALSRFAPSAANDLAISGSEIVTAHARNKKAAAGPRLFG